MMRSSILLFLATQAYYTFALPASSTIPTPTFIPSTTAQSTSTSTSAFASTETFSSETSSYVSSPSSSVNSLPKATTAIKLDDAIVVGVTDGETRRFLGIPYAQSPVGDLRFEPPQPVGPYQGVVNATYWGNQCLNTVGSSETLPPWVTPAMIDYFNTLTRSDNTSFDEDCLNLNVIAPAYIPPGAKLPVVAYIFFGAFFFGNSADVDGSTIVKRSIELGQPVIFVSLNHRLGPYGFLAGKEVMEARIGNAGLRDQREALRWIQRYIPTFGGDRHRVTILGFSSGAVSAAYQMVANGGDSEGLFNGVWAESGAIQSAGWLDQPPAQKSYDNLVAQVNCTNAIDTLACLKTVPAAALTKAGGLYNRWQPHVDGVFFRRPPLQALANGEFARVPVIAGNAEDEGTVFTIGSPNLTTTADFKSVVRTGYYPNISDADMDRLLGLYPNDPALGAPYFTGTQFQLTPQWKRAASFLGDAGVVSVRKRFTQTLAKFSNPVWAYYYRRNMMPGLGSTHGSELTNMYGPGDMTNLLVNFANSYNPNGKARLPIQWEGYLVNNPVALDFYGNDSLQLIPDTYREEPLNLLMQLNTEEALPF